MMIIIVTFGGTTPVRLGIGIVGFFFLCSLLVSIHADSYVVLFGTVASPEARQKRREQKRIELSRRGRKEE